jgi:hypothetical protein
MFRFLGSGFVIVVVFKKTKMTVMMMMVVIIIIIKKNLDAVPGKHSIDSLQKTTILGTSHTIRKLLQCEA